MLLLNTMDRAQPTRYEEFEKSRDSGGSRGAPVEHDGLHAPDERSLPLCQEEEEAHDQGDGAVD